MKIYLRINSEYEYNKTKMKNFRSCFHFEYRKFKIVIPENMSRESQDI